MTSLITLKEVFHVDPRTPGKGERKWSLMNFRKSVTSRPPKNVYPNIIMSQWTFFGVNFYGFSSDLRSDPKDDQKTLHLNQKTTDLKIQGQT